jgi:sigma-E factor negative regulatory protein RseC
MIETRAKVVRAGAGIALVEAENRGTCGHCDTEGGCGKSAMGKLFCSKPRTFEVIDNLGCRVGDEVSIGVQDGALLKGAVAVYMVPMFLLLAGSLFGNMWGDGAAVLGGGVGLLIGFFWARHYSVANRGNPRFQPYILEIF